MPGREIDQLAAFFALLVVAEIEFELVVFGVLVELDDHLGREGPTRLGAETFQRPDLLVAQELLHLGHLERPPGRRLAE